MNNSPTRILFNDMWENIAKHHYVIFVFLVGIIVIGLVHWRLGKRLEKQLSADQLKIFNEAHRKWMGFSNIIPVFVLVYCIISFEAKFPPLIWGVYCLPIFISSLLTMLSPPVRRAIPTTFLFAQVFLALLVSASMFSLMCIALLPPN